MAKTLKEQLAELRAQTLRYRLGALGIQVPETPETYYAEEPPEVKEDVVIDEPDKPWYSKAWEGIGKAAKAVGDTVEEYMVDPWVGTVMSIGYALPGTLKGEEEWRDRISEGGSPWDYLQRTADVVEEEYPWWTKEVIGATNPLFWVNPSGVIGHAAKGMGGAAKLAHGAKMAQGARAAERAQRATLSASAWVAKAENMAVKPITYPVSRVLKSPLYHRNQMKMHKAMSAWVARHPKWFTKQAQREMAGERVSDFADAYNLMPITGSGHEGAGAMLAERTTDSLAKKLKMVKDRSPAIMESRMARDFPDELASFQKHLDEIERYHMKFGSNAAEMNYFEVLARNSSNTDEMIYTLARDARAANAVETGLATEIHKTTRLGRANGVTDDAIVQAQANKSAEFNEWLDNGWITKGFKTKKPNPIFRGNQKVKSKLLYPAVLAARPGWLTYNAAYNHFMPFYYKGFGIMTGYQGRGLKLLQGFKGRPQWTGSHGFGGLSPEARDLGDPAVLREMVEEEDVWKAGSWWDRGGKRNPAKIIQALSFKSERFNHAVIYNTSVDDNFCKALRGILDEEVAAGNITGAQAARLKGIRNGDDLQSVLGNWKRDEYLGQFFPKNELNVEARQMLDDLLERGEVSLATPDEVERTVRVLKEEMRKYYDELGDSYAINFGTDEESYLLISERVSAEVDEMIRGTGIDDAGLQEIRDWEAKHVAEQTALSAEERQLIKDIPQYDYPPEELKLLDKFFEVRGNAAAGYRTSHIAVSKQFRDEIQKLKLAGVKSQKEYDNVFKKFMRKDRELFERFKTTKHKYLDDLRKVRDRVHTGDKKLFEYGIKPDEASEILEKMGLSHLDPAKDVAWKEMVVREMSDPAMKNIDSAYAQWQRDAWQAAPDAPDIEVVNRIFGDALNEGQMLATMETNRTLFNYSHQSMLDFALGHVSPFPFFQNRHLLSMAMLAFERPRQFAFFAQVLNKWYQANSDKPESLRWSWETPLELNDGTKILFRPQSWLQPMHMPIMEVVALGNGEGDTQTVLDTVRLTKEFTGNFLYPQVELIASTAAPQWTGTRYAAIRDPFEVMKGMIPQYAMGVHAMGNFKSTTGFAIQNQQYMLNQQQLTACHYAIQELVNDGEITLEQGHMAADNLRKGIADEWNTKAAQIALGGDRGFWVKMAQFHGLPLTAYTPGWAKSEMVRRQSQEGVPEGKRRLNLPSYFDELKEVMPGTALNYYIPPKELTRSDQNTWRKAVDYWHQRDMAMLSRQQRQIEIDAWYEDGQIDGKSWVSLRNENYRAWGLSMDDLDKRHPDALKGGPELREFYRRIGREVLPTHPLRGYIEKYFEIEMDEGYPPDYESLRLRREQYLKSIPVDAADYVRWYAQKNLTPTERKYKESVAIMTPYWSIERIVMEKRGLLDEWKSVRGNPQFEYRMRMENTAYAEALKEVAKYRKWIRQSDPTVDAAYASFWGLAPSAFSS